MNYEESEKHIQRLEAEVETLRQWRMKIPSEKEELLTRIRSLEEELRKSHSSSGVVLAVVGLAVGFDDYRTRTEVAEAKLRARGIQVEDE